MLQAVKKWSVEPVVPSEASPLTKLPYDSPTSLAASKPVTPQPGKSVRSCQESILKDVCQNNGTLTRACFLVQLWLRPYKQAVNTQQAVCWILAYYVQKMKDKNR